jgi:hypothetical protein
LSNQFHGIGPMKKSIAPTAGIYICRDVDSLGF